MFMSFHYIPWMTDQPDASDPLRAWLEATGGPGPSLAEAGDGGPRPHARRLVVAAGALCLVAALLAVAAGRHATLGSAATAASATGTAPAAGASGSAVAPDTPPAPPIDPPTPAPNGVPDALAAPAVLAVRDGAPADRYVDTAVAESLFDIGDVTVVTVRALVLRRVHDGWSHPHHARYAVPVHSDGQGVEVLAAPWLLPPPDPQLPVRSWSETGTASLRQVAHEAVAAAGYRVRDEVRLQRDAALPEILRCRFRGTAPGEDRAGEHEVWLSADGRRVLGGPAVGVEIPLEQP